MNFIRTDLEKPSSESLSLTLELNQISDCWRSLLTDLDQLVSSPSDSSPYSPKTFALGADIPHSPSELCLICEGRVRILTTPQTQPRETTALLLAAGDSFGAEDCFGAVPTGYRAIAASPVQIVTIPIAHLERLFSRFSQWRDVLHHQAEERDRLLFLKTCTELHSVPSRHLRPLWQDWAVERIAAGTAIAEATTATEGRFWLRQGKLRTTDKQCPPPDLGESWGYPDKTPPSWIADTEITVYRLSPELWDNLQRLKPGGHSLKEAAQRTMPVQNLVAATTMSPATNNTATVASPPTGAMAAVERAPVLFPKPARRRLLDWFERFPWVEQQSSSDCGAACLAMILRYWGKRLPLYALRDRADVGRSGASLKSLGKAAETLGFQARPVRASLNRMLEQPNPWIAHWQGNHYVVVYRSRGNRVLIADPAVGRRSISRREFQKHWTGFALLLAPTTQITAIETQQPSLRKYLGFLLSYRNLALQIVLVSLLIQVFGLVTPLFTQVILDQIVVQKSQSTLNVFALGLLLFSVWSLGMVAVRQYLLSYFSNRLDLTLISGFIRHALTLPLKFFEARRVGDILTRVQENQKIQRFLVGQVVLAGLDFVTGFVYLALMFYYNWRLTLLVIALIPPIVLLTLGSTPLLRRVSREIFAEAADQNSSLVEMMNGVATVKAAAAEQELRWRWEEHLTRQLNATFRGQRLGIGLQVTSGLIQSVGNAMLLWYGATLVIQNQLTVGQFVAFNMMIGFVISPVVSLSNLWDELQEVLISVERLDDVFEAKPEELPGHPLLVLPSLSGTVQFENVTFRYGEDEEHNVLQNVSFDVQPGQTIAIVGRSGSGKTTLAKLIQGLYFPVSGRVFIDGHDVRHVSMQSLRSQIGAVPQECFLFSGTILENITLYRPEFSLEQVVEVAKLAEAHAFIQSLPLGYSTQVGERGSVLSGGQRQRVAIARALLREPRILVLDEATSALDTESERRFQRNLMQISRDRTTFIIAHRLSTVRHANRILVLDRGVLVEQGDHEFLMKQQGLYYHLAQQQLDL